MSSFLWMCPKYDQSQNPPSSRYRQNPVLVSIHDSTAPWHSPYTWGHSPLIFLLFFSLSSPLESVSKISTIQAPNLLPQPPFELFPNLASWKFHLASCLGPEPWHQPWPSPLSPRMSITKPWQLPIFRVWTESAYWSAPLPLPSGSKAPHSKPRFFFSTIS